VWNADESRVRCPKKASPPEVIVAVNTKPGSAAIPEARDDAQFTLLTAISAFGDWTYAFFISKLKTFGKTLPAAQKLYKGYDYTIRSASRTFMTKILFIYWLETFFLPRISGLRQKVDYNGPGILVVDGHSTHVTPPVIALCEIRKIILVRLVPHSSRVAQPLELCLFALFNITYRKEKQGKGMKAETRKYTGHYWRFTKARSFRWFAGVLNKPDFVSTPAICWGR
jgi:hypothetical protein